MLQLSLAAMVMVTAARAVPPGPCQQIANVRQELTEYEKNLRIKNAY